jgi:hypothetical protein
MRFFTIKGRIGGGFPGAHALRAEPFAAQQAADPFVGHRGKQFASPAILGELGDRPNRERQTTLGRTGQGYIHQFPELLGAEDRRPSSRIGNLFEAGEPTLIEAAHPVIGHREMAADSFGHLHEPISPAHQIDDAVTLVDAGGQGQVAKLGP